MRTVSFAVREGLIDPIGPQYAGVQGEHEETTVKFAVPADWIAAGYAVRAEWVDGEGGFDTTDFLALNDGEAVLPLPIAWTAAGGLAELRLAAALPGTVGMPLEAAAYTPVAYLYFESRTDEPAAWQEFPNRGLSALIADCHAAAGTARDTADGLTRQQAAGEFDGTRWFFGTLVSGEGPVVEATVAGAKPRDAYLNTDTYTVYRATEEEPLRWTAVGCLRGNGMVHKETLFEGAATEGATLAFGVSPAEFDHLEIYMNYGVAAVAHTPGDEYVYAAGFGRCTAENCVTGTVCLHEESPLSYTVSVCRQNGGTEQLFQPPTVQKVVGVTYLSAADLSPAATATRIENGVVLTVNDKNGTTAATVYDGAKGDRGEKGERGDSGVYVGETEPDPSADIWIDTGEHGRETTDYVLADLGVNVRRSGVIADGKFPAISHTLPRPVDISREYAAGCAALQLDVCVSGDEAFLQALENQAYSGQLELTSSGVCDRREINCRVPPVITWRREEWVRVVIPLSRFSAMETGGTFDPAAVNYFRLYLDLFSNELNGQSGTLSMANVRLVDVSKEAPYVADDPLGFVGSTGFLKVRGQDGNWTLVDTTCRDAGRTVVLYESESGAADGETVSLCNKLRNFDELRAVTSQGTLAVYTDESGSIASFAAGGVNQTGTGLFAVSGTCTPGTPDRLTLGLSPSGTVLYRLTGIRHEP